MSNQQNENLNTLGFTTSLLRRNLVVGFIIVIILAWYFTYSELQKDKDNLFEKISKLENRNAELMEQHIKSLQDEISKRDEMLQKIENHEKSANKIEKKIDQLD